MTQIVYLHSRWLNEVPEGQWLCSRHLQVQESLSQIFLGAMLRHSVSSCELWQTHLQSSDEYWCLDGLQLSSFTLPGVEGLIALENGPGEAFAVTYTGIGIPRGPRLECSARRLPGPPICGCGSWPASPPWTRSWSGCRPFDRWCRNILRTAELWRTSGSRLHFRRNLSRQLEQLSFRVRKRLAPRSWPSFDLRWGPSRRSGLTRWVLTGPEFRRHFGCQRSEVAWRPSLHWVSEKSRRSLFSVP